MVVMTVGKSFINAKNRWAQYASLHGVLQREQVECLIDGFPRKHTESCFLGNSETSSISCQLYLYSTISSANYCEPCCQRPSGIKSMYIASISSLEVMSWSKWHNCVSDSAQMKILLQY